MINIALIKEFLCLEKHTQVIDLIEQVVGASLKHFIIIKNEKSVIYIPRNIKQKLPVLSAHTDTVFKNKPTQLSLQIKHGIMSNKNKEGLGADDRAGCYFLSQVMKSNPKDFIFAFFDEEEGGCKGSRDFEATGIKNYVKVWVGFDRKGNKDIATYRVDNKTLTAAIEADYFKGFKKEWGSSTDVAVLARETKIACMNFSVGFRNEHTSGETLSLQVLDNTFSLIQPLIDLPLEQYEQEVVPITYSYSRDRSLPYSNNYGEVYFTTYYCNKCYREYEINEKYKNECCGQAMKRINPGGYI